MPDPERLLTAYHQSASTLNLLRAFTKGGFADLSRVHAWNQEFVASSAEGRRYEELAAGIDRALRFMAACGIDTEATPQLHTVDVWTSHEALILGYEEALTRQDSLTGDWYDCSAHMLWIGERTRQLDGAHVHFLSGVGQPARLQGRPHRHRRRGPRPVRGAQPRPRPRAGSPSSPAWAPSTSARRCPRCCGRSATPATRWRGPATRCTATPSPPRAVARPATSTPCCREIAGFFAAHREVGTWPGGVHIELTGDDVTECLGGAEEILDADLGTRYETMCDPRLNARQSLDLAFRVAELLQART